jgi:hypothetical protein
MAVEPLQISVLSIIAINLTLSEFFHDGYPPNFNRSSSNMKLSDSGYNRAMESWDMVLLMNRASPMYLYPCHPERYEAL